MQFNDSQLIFNAVTCVIKAFFVTNGSEKKSPVNNGDGSEEKIKKYNKAMVLLPDIRNGVWSKM